MFALRLLLVGATAVNAAEKTATKAQVVAMFQENCYNKPKTGAAGKACADAETPEKCAGWDATKSCATSVTAATASDVLFQALMQAKCAASATEVLCVAVDACPAEATFPKALLEATAGTADLKRVKDDKGTMSPMDTTEPRDLVDKKEICGATTGRLCSPCKWDKTTTKCTQNVKIGTAAVMIALTPDICAKAASNGVRSATMFGAAVASMFALIMA